VARAIFSSDLIGGYSRLCTFACESKIVSATRFGGSVCADEIMRSCNRARSDHPKALVVQILRLVPIDRRPIWVAQRPHRR